LPLVSSALKGSTAGITKYTDIWDAVRRPIGKGGFPAASDCKPAPAENMRRISHGKGLCLCPSLSRSKKGLQLLADDLAEPHETELLLDAGKAGGKVVRCACLAWRQGWRARSTIAHAAKGG
jgi:hypothetical protein